MALKTKLKKRSRQRLYLIVALFIVVFLAGLLFYVGFNFFSSSQTLQIDQSGVDETILLESLQQAPSTTETSASDSLKLIKSGTFSRFDEIHQAVGTAQIYQTPEGPILKLEDFATSNGPDLFVYLATEPNITGIKSPIGETVSLGPLKQIQGDQVYVLPDNYSDYNSVVIWCRAFAINFSSAPLTNE